MVHARLEPPVLFEERSRETNLAITRLSRQLLYSRTASPRHSNRLIQSVKIIQHSVEVANVKQAATPLARHVTNSSVKLARLGFYSYSLLERILGTFRPGTYSVYRWFFTSGARSSPGTFEASSANSSSFSSM